jgi:hypothetical protein
MTRLYNQRCDKCIFWEMLKNDIPQSKWLNDISYGFCKRFPSGSNIEMDPDILGFWITNKLSRFVRISKTIPLKGYDDWCGEFKIHI